MHPCRRRRRKGAAAAREGKPLENDAPTLDALVISAGAAARPVDGALRPRPGAFRLAAEALAAGLTVRLAAEARAAGPAGRLAAETLAAETLAAETLAAETLAAETLAAETLAAGPSVRFPPDEAEAAPGLERLPPGDLAAALAAAGLPAGRTALVAANAAEAEAGRRAGLALVAGPPGSGADLVVADPAELAVAGGRPGPRALGQSTLGPRALGQSTLSQSTLGQSTRGPRNLVLRTLASVPDATPEALRAALRGRRPAVFLDYDGVLAPIVADHTRTAMAPGMRAALAALAGTMPTAIVSGRDLAGLRRLVPVPGLRFAGSHGFEIAGPDGGVEDGRGRPFLPDLDAAEATLRRALAPVPGHSVERKRFSVAVHYRRVAEADVPAVAAAVDAVLADRPKLARGLGKKVFELQPAIDWNKGRAVEWLLGRLGLDGPEVLPLYVGDDITDEHAFRVLAGRGLGIVVRHDESRATAADLGLADVDAVERLLRLLAAGGGQAG